MNKLLRLQLVSALCTVFCMTQAIAQCSFTPTINVSPVDADGIYCPGDILTLSTQNYDDVNWFYNFSNSNSGGTAWPGGAGTSILVNATEWAVVYFYVVATDDGCSEASATVVWDGWNFLPPSIASSGQSSFCEGESTMISNAFNGPSLFQWYKDGVLIQGATSSSYSVTETGTYTLSAAYAECPNYWQSSGVGPNFTFSVPIIPVISAMNGTLSADSGTSWQWLFEGTDIPGATDQEYKPDLEGVYSVRVVDVNGCDALSAPFLFPEGPLPIELLNIQVRPKAACIVELFWEVAPESTAANYSIEMSTDGIYYSTIRNITAGNRSAFTEQIELSNSDAYFRLAMYSLEETLNYSPIIFAENNCPSIKQNDFKIYPNPASNLFTIESNYATPVNLRIYNSQGQLIISESFEATKQAINSSEWPNGVYQIMLATDGMEWVQRVVKI